MLRLYWCNQINKRRSLTQAHLKDCKNDIGQRTIDIKAKEKENVRQNNGLNMNNIGYKANINSS